MINVTEVRETVPGHTVPDFPTVAPLEHTQPILSSEGTPLYVFLIQVLTAWLCYIFGKQDVKLLLLVLLLRMEIKGGVTSVSHDSVS